MKRFFNFLIPFALLAALLSLYVFAPDPLEALRLRFFDTFQHLKPREYVPSPVRIIDVDETTLKKFGQWPWPRLLTARLVDRLREEGAAVIAFDVLFAEADRTSPRNILPLWPDTPETQALKSAAADTLPDHDTVLAEAIAKTKVITAFSLDAVATGRKPLRRAGFSMAGDDPRQFLPNFPGAITNIPQLDEAASGSAVINYFPEYDGIIRRIPILFQLDGMLYPQLGLESVRLLLGAGGYIVKSSGASSEFSFGHKNGIVAIKLADRVIPVDEKGRLWLYDTGMIPERTIPAWRVLEKTEGLEGIRGSIVYIGTSAIGLKDLRATPLLASIPGVDLHAQVAEQILNRDFLNRPDWAQGAEVVFLVIVGSLLILVMPFLGAAWSAVVGVASFVGMYLFSWYCFAQHRWLVDPLIPSAACLVIYLSSSLIHFLKTDSEKRHIRGAFTRYLPPAIVEELAKNPERLKLGGERRDMTLIFADIRGFTTLSEGFEPEELTHFINRYLTPMTGIILEEHGTIDKYMGDCIMAFWNAPLDDADHAAHACRAALRMQKYLLQWNESLRLEAQAAGRVFREVRIGIGINSGTCCVGNMGSDQRFDYSVLGDEVNLASRLESLSKDYGVDIIIGEHTKEKLNGFSMLELDLVQVKGKTTPTRIYALLGEESLPGLEVLSPAHTVMLEAYRSRRWEEAAALIKKLKTLPVEGRDLNSLYVLYEKRIAVYEKQPPGKEWNGVMIATSK